MLDMFDGTALDQLAVALSGSYSMSLCDGKVRLLCRSLPGRAVSTLRRVGDVLYVVLDLDKPRAIHEAWDMVQEWYGSFVQPEVAKDGHVNLVPLPRLQDRPEDPVSLTLGL